jgi:hypothetical protein
MAAVVVLVLPGVLFTTGAGFVFGVVKGSIYVVTGTTLGAVLAFLNSRVIQHNLDWVWPYWIERQFDPHDVSFIPRAFSITHINLTHRNWTALGYPDCPELPIVDPRGLLTPILDGWSLDGWLLPKQRRCPEEAPHQQPKQARSS